MASGSLVIKLTVGKNDAERCNQAFNVAATALASGVPVSLWLTGEASWFALPGKAEEVRLPYATPLHELLAAILQGGGTVTLCTQCAARREISEDLVMDGVRIAGSATFVAEVLADGAKPLIY